jgi:starch synthase
VLFATSELYPLAQTGGLGDVSAALPPALHALGADVRVLMPAYPSAIAGTVSRGRRVPIGSPAGLGETALIAARTPDTDVPVFLVDCPALFERPGGPYADADGADHPDNAARFALLSHAAALLAGTGSPLKWTPDVVHANDWPTGLVPAILATRHEGRPPTVFTIHNLAFPGRFPYSMFSTLGLPAHTFHMHGVEFFGDVSFVKAGAYYADRITTVSPTYAREIQTKAFGCGLEGLLAGRRDDLIGVLNGVDYGRWDPARDRDIEACYGPDTLTGKRACKAALQREFDLDVREDAFLLGSVTRLTPQKGLDLLLDALPAVLSEGVQLVVLGSGDKKMERGFTAAAKKFPRRLGLRIGYDEPLSHRVEAGADAFVMPSRYEPCGLNQMYSLKYGTPPVVHAVGGLADTIADGVNGFSFEKPAAGALGVAVGRAEKLFRRPAEWRAMQQRGMAEDFSWSRSAAEYLAIYQSLLKM